MPAAAATSRRELCRARAPARGLNADALGQQFVVACRAWCAYPNHPDTIRELNESSAEYLLRGEPAPVRSLTEDVAILCKNIAYKPENLQDQPLVFIAVVLERLRLVVLFAPFLWALLIRDCDRYGPHPDLNEEPDKQTAPPQPAGRNRRRQPREV
jgi:hypothetical protein